MIRISWTSSEDIDILKYLIDIAGSQAGPWTRIAEENYPATHSDIFGVDAASSWFRIGAQDTGGNVSSWSIPKQAIDVELPTQIIGCQISELTGSNNPNVRLIISADSPAILNEKGVTKNNVKIATDNNGYAEFEALIGLTIKVDIPEMKWEKEFTVSAAPSALLFADY